MLQDSALVRSARSAVPSAVRHLRRGSQRGPRAAAYPAESYPALRQGLAQLDKLLHASRINKARKQLEVVARDVALVAKDLTLVAKELMINELEMKARVSLRRSPGQRCSASGLIGGAANGAFSSPSATSGIDRT